MLKPGGRSTPPSTLRSGAPKPWTKSNSPSLHRTQCDSIYDCDAVVAKHGDVQVLAWATDRG